MYFTVFHLTLFTLATVFLHESKAISCAGSATYKLTFQADWTVQTHPEDFPGSDNPHFSSLVGCTHNGSYVMWKPGMNATTGVKDVAENGVNTELNKEMNQQISLKTAYKKFERSGISNVGSVTEKDVQVNTEYPLVSAISMIAPSPDWFVGVHDFSLCDWTTGKWLYNRVRNLSLYDSGTDSAPRFVHADTPTVPPVPIFLITNAHEGSLKSNKTIARFGTFNFVKTYDSNTEPTTDQSSTLTSTPTSKAHRINFQIIYAFLSFVIIYLI